MATVSARNITSTSVTVRVSGVTKGDELYFFVRLADDTSDVSGYAYDSAYNTSAEADIKGLQPGTQYLANVRVNGKWQTAVKFWTDEEEVDFGGSLSTSTTQSSISVRLTNINTSYPSNHKMRFTFSVAYNEVTSFTFYVQSSRTSWYTKDGLKPNTQYYVEVEVEDLATGWSDTWTAWVRTDKLAVEKWDWNISNGTATAAQTKAALKALTSKGPTTDFSYLVWNDMCTKVQAIQNAAGKSWSTKYATFNNTKMTSSDRRITATRFNSLRYNIGINESTGINEVDQGDIVMAWYFTTLANTMNIWIDKL